MQHVGGLQIATFRFDYFAKRHIFLSIYQGFYIFSVDAFDDVFA